MKISELIKHLKKCKKENGDLPVILSEGDDYESQNLPVAGIVVTLDDDGKPSHALLCDDELLDFLP